MTRTAPAWPHLAAGAPGCRVGQQLQLSALHRDGHEFPIELTPTVAEEPGGRMFHAFAHDITNARRAVRFADVEVALALGLRPDHRLSRRRHRYRHPPHCERPRLFRRLYRASTALDQPIPGTALGLVITRTIVERHHGAIALAEHTGPGTTFVV